MLSNLEIDAILRSSVPASECVRRLIDAALEKGGKDNTTVIVCRIG
jgi:serine/threonine protein phosphatase PrpC